jgi:hypothetical protein
VVGGQKMPNEVVSGVGVGGVWRGFICKNGPGNELRLVRHSKRRLFSRRLQRTLSALLNSNLEPTQARLFLPN